MASAVIAINADVYEPDAMMTGRAETSEQRIEAGGLARSVKDVKRVYNQFLVQRDIDKQKVQWKISSTTRLSKARRMPCYSMRTAQVRPTSDGDR